MGQARYGPVASHVILTAGPFFRPLSSDTDKCPGYEPRVQPNGVTAAEIFNSRFQGFM